MTWMLTALKLHVRYPRFVVGTLRGQHRPEPLWCPRLVAASFLTLSNVAWLRCILLRLRSSQSPGGAFFRTLRPRWSNVAAMLVSTVATPFRDAHVFPRLLDALFVVSLVLAPIAVSTALTGKTLQALPDGANARAGLVPLTAPSVALLLAGSLAVAAVGPPGLFFAMVSPNEILIWRQPFHRSSVVAPPSENHLHCSSGRTPSHREGKSPIPQGKRFSAQMRHAAHIRPAWRTARQRISQKSTRHLPGFGR